MMGSPESEKERIKNETQHEVTISQMYYMGKYAVTQAQYTAGGGAYLSVLTAEQSDYSARLNLITARTARFTDTVALFQALGGGWWNRLDVRPESNGKPGVFNLPPVDQVHLPRAGH